MVGHTFLWVNILNSSLNSQEIKNVKLPCMKILVFEGVHYKSYLT